MSAREEDVKAGALSLQASLALPGRVVVVLVVDVDAMSKEAFTLRADFAASEGAVEAVRDAFLASANILDAELKQWLQ